MHRSNKVPFKGTLTSKAFSIFLALTLCVPTTLAGNLSHVRQAQADTSVPQEQSTGGDALDSAPDGASIGEAADSAQAQDAPDSPALSPALDWSAQYHALVLSSKGLTVDVEKLVESVRESGTALSSGDTQAQAAQSGESHPAGSQAAAPSGAAQSELPSTIPATLDLSFELAPQLGSAIRARILPRAQIRPRRQPSSARASTRWLSPAIGSRWSFQKSSSPQMKRLRSTCSKTTSKATPQR